ncbi:MAG: S9 family peptidase [Phycisphaeraceae bacterium]|nr:S9 family peptidase [Phycisphaeraceae bacterium]
MGRMDAVQYPPTYRATTNNVYFGVEVPSPYQWMEDLESVDVDNWIADQNSISLPYLASLPYREEIRDQYEKLINYERYSAPGKSGGRYFYSYNSGLMNQNQLFVMDSLDGDARLLIDPNTFSDDGTVALGGTEVSDDGRYIAYSKQIGGSDWRTWYVHDIESGEDTSDVLEFIKFSGVSWSKDNAGFYYSRYPSEGGTDLSSTNENLKVYYHTLGTPQSNDRMIYELPSHPRRGPYAGVTEDGDYLIIQVHEGFNANAIHYKSLTDDRASVVRLFDEWDAQYDFLDNDGSTFFFLTTKDAPNWRVVAIDVNQSNAGTDPSLWRDVVPEGAEAIDSAAFVGGRLIVRYLKDAKSVVRVFEKDGSFVRDVALPGIGTASGFGGRDNDPETSFEFSSYTSPRTAYTYNVQTGEVSLFRKPEIDVDLDKYVVNQVFYSSKDGTRVPMFLVHRKDIVLNGANPTLLYGYGGFNVSLTPGFSTSRVLWLEMGGVYAVPNLRGGGEYGESWHEAGTKLNKQNVFDDFISAAEWLIANGYTRPDKLAIQGGSNGGLLVGACMTQRPDLFGCCLPAVGVLDMLRYHTPTIARAWSTDYGLSENEDEFHALYAYSPLHNVREGTCYPPTLVTTADRDDRVVPWHSFKFTSALQHAQECANPILIRVETDAGHGSGKPISKVIEEVADEWAFVAKALDMHPEFHAN